MDKKAPWRILEKGHDETNPFFRYSSLELVRDRERKWQSGNRRLTVNKSDEMRGEFVARMISFQWQANIDAN